MRSIIFLVTAFLAIVPVYSLDTNINNGIVPGFRHDEVEALTIDLQEVPSRSDALILHLDGYVDSFNSSPFSEQVEMVISAGYGILIFNCADLSYLSSTGIGPFIGFLKKLKPRGGEVIFADVRPDVYELFQLLGFSRFFIVKESLEESIAFLDSL